jgi:hypothetical protein
MRISDKLRNAGKTVRGLFSRVPEQSRAVEVPKSDPVTKETAATTPTNKRRRQAYSNRGRGRGIETPSGFLSRHDLRCLIMQGCDLFVAFPNAKNRLRAMGFRQRKRSAAGADNG